MNPVDIQLALQAALQVLGLVQQAMANGETTISAADYQTSVTLRDGNIAQLDADIAKERAAEQGSAGAAPTKS